MEPTASEEVVVPRIGDYVDGEQKRRCMQIEKLMLKIEQRKIKLVY